jgi:hypothetical protein
MEKQRRLKSYSIDICERGYIQPLIEKWHYSGSLTGVNSEYCFSLHTDRGILAGGAVLGQPASPGTYRKYSERSKWNLIEIRKLALVDDTPRNAESYFIGGILRWLKKNTRYHRVLAFSDSRQGHVGTIYKASNFLMVDVVRARSIRYGDRDFHPRVLHRTGPTAREVQAAHERGDTAWVVGKLYAYVYDLVHVPIVST